MTTDQYSSPPLQATRRQLLSGAPLTVAALLGITALAPAASRAATRAARRTLPLAAPTTADVPEGFPKTEFQRVYDTVLKAHSDKDVVQALVEHTPSLANAAMDWAFGDWESAVGAAAHMGRRDIAEVLLENGARPDIYTHAMLGHADAVESAIAAMPGVQRTLGPHGLTLMFHAKAGGEAATKVVKLLKGLGDADPQHANAPGAAELNSYTGSFRYSSAPDLMIEIAERRGQLTLKTATSFPQGLFHLGDHVFHPNGVPSIRVGFQMKDGKAVAVKIGDKATLVEGERIA